MVLNKMLVDAGSNFTVAKGYVELKPHLLQTLFCYAPWMKVGASKPLVV